MTPRGSDNSLRARTALVLPGGGARGAFQVGVLKALAELLPKGTRNPFGIISGTSAGAVNSIVLASKARRFKTAVAELEGVWSAFRCHHVYRTDHLTMLKSSLHWLASVMLGGFLVGTPRSLLDNSPLHSLLSRNVRFPRIDDAILAAGLVASLELPAGLPPGAGQSIEVLVDAFRGVPGAVAVDVFKRREGFQLDGCIAELVQVTVGGHTTHSICVEGVDAERVLDLAQRLGLAGLPNISYLAEVRSLQGWERELSPGPATRKGKAT